MFTREDLIDAIEEEGDYSRVYFHEDSKVVGFDGEEVVFIGNDTELLSALVDAGKVSQEEADTYGAEPTKTELAIETLKTHILEDDNLVGSIEGSGGCGESVFDDIEQIECMRDDNTTLADTVDASPEEKKILYKIADAFRS